MLKNTPNIAPLKSKRSKVTLMLLMALVINGISFFTVNYRDTSGGYNMDQIFNKFGYSTMATSQLINDSNDLVSRGFIRANYLNSLMLYDYKIPETLVEDKPITYDFDPRLTLGVYMHHLSDSLRLGSQDLEIPFSWYDFIDIGSVLNEFINLPENLKFGCSFVCTSRFDGFDEQEMQDRFASNGGSSTIPRERKLEKRTRNPARVEQMAICDEYCREDSNPAQPGFRVFKNLAYGRPNIKHIHSKSYLYSEAPVPQSLVLITQKGNLQAGIKSVGDDKTIGNMVNSGILHKYVASKGRHIHVLEGYNELLAVMNTEEPSNILDERDFKVELKHERFIFNGPEYLSNLKVNSLLDESLKKSLEHSLQSKEMTLNKHFHEPKLRDEGDSITGFHYDWRFFNGLASDQEQKHQYLSRLLKTWSALVSNAKLVSWIAHGGLLSHSFNGMLFPWDDDLDVQMPINDLIELARLYNDSVILENPKDGYGAYYLDVSDSITHRAKGNNKNHIDARFIDIRTGFFIDITALAVSPINLPISFAEQFETVKDTPMQYVNPNRRPDDDIEAERIANIDPEIRKGLDELQVYSQELGLMWNLTSDEMYDKTYKLQLYNCRNGHVYNLHDLSPVRLSFLEQVPVYVPNNITNVLRSEYRPQTHLTTEYAEFTYLPQLRIWIETEKLLNLLPYNRFYDKNLYTKEDLMKLLDDQDIMESYKLSHEATMLNEKEKMILDSELPKSEKELLLKKFMNHDFKPITKDPFVSYLELQTDELVSMEEIVKYYIKEMKKEVEREYTGAAYDQELKSIGSMRKLLNIYIKEKADHQA